MSQFTDAECGIRQLHAHYTDAVWRKDADALGNCFAEDAEWRIAGMVLQGRASITNAFASLMGKAGHVLMTFRTPLVELTDTGRADVRTYVTEQCTWLAGPPTTSIGRYFERCVLEGDRWRFSWRLFQLLYKGPADMTGPFYDAPDFGPFPGMPPLDWAPADPTSANLGS